MEPFRVCIKQIIELRELEKSQEQKHQYIESESDSDAETIKSVTDSDDMDDHELQTINCKPTTPAKCRDDKYFEAIYKVVNSPPRDDIYDTFGKYIANQIRNTAKINGQLANVIMADVQEAVLQLKQDSMHEIDNRVPD